jgi:hypothetical protein
MRRVESGKCAALKAARLLLAGPRVKLRYTKVWWWEMGCRVNTPEERSWESGRRFCLEGSIMTKCWSGLERYILVAKFLVFIFERSHKKLQRGSWCHSALL